MRRRDFIRLISGVAAWPLAARAQQPAMPIVGFLTGRSSVGSEQVVIAFRQGLSSTGYVEGRDFTIDFRWAYGHYDQLPRLVSDLIGEKVSVIAATTIPAALAARTATATIPIVIETGEDPVQLGLVASLDHPGGNVTGVSQLNTEVASKRLELLHRLLPSAHLIALLVNPANHAAYESNIREVSAAARTLGVEIETLKASTDDDFDSAFAKLTQLRAGGLVVGGDAFFISRSERLGELALRYAVPAVFESRASVAAGGLVSYGGSITEAYRLVGIYSGRILKGDKAADLPVQLSTKIEMFLNLKTAKALGIGVPQALLVAADGVIE